MPQSFRDKFSGKAETVTKDGRRESVSTNASSPSRQQTGKRETTANYVKVANPKSNVQHNYQVGTLVNDSDAVVVPMHKQDRGPVLYPSHHQQSVTGVQAKAAEGTMPNSKDPSQRGRRKLVTSPADQQEGGGGQRGGGGEEGYGEEGQDPVEQYFKRHQKRLPALPDFHSPPPIMHGRRAIREPDPEPILGDYKPHTFKEYKRSQEQYEKQRFGGLGPSDSEEKQMWRSKRQKMFAYGRSVNAVNFTMMDVPERDPREPPQVIPRKLDREGQIGLIKRERALRYGEQFSHPKYREKTYGRGGAYTPDPRRTDLSALEKELQDLQEKQQHDLEEIARVKEQLKLEERY